VVSNQKLFGLGYRTPHYNEVIATKPPLGFFEIVSENFISPAVKPRMYLEQLCALYPVAMHGVGLSIGGPDAPQKEYLQALKHLADFIKPNYISDHLCWTSVGQHNSHDLLPMPYTREALDLVIERVSMVQEFLGRKILLENPSAYVDFAGREYSDAQFYTELCQRSGCGILLDINNLYVNQINLGLSASAVIQGLPLNALGYFHLAGHSTQHNVLIDTHDGPVADAVWPLYAEAVKRWPSALTLLEWDGKIPALAVLLEELNRAQKMRDAFATEIFLPAAITASKPDKLLAVQKNFFNFVTDLSRQATVAHLNEELPVTANAGSQVYRDAYLLRIVEVMSELYPAVAHIMDEEPFGEVVRDYLTAYPPHNISVTFEGRDFAKFLLTGDLGYDFGVPQALLSQLAALEWAQIECFFEPNWDIFPVWKEFSQGRATAIPAQQSAFAIVARPQNTVNVESISALEAQFLASWKSGEPLRGEQMTERVEFFLKCLRLELVVGIKL
jgi:uncharacterized protein (UPF0276 family)